MTREYVFLEGTMITLDTEDSAQRRTTATAAEHAVLAIPFFQKRLLLILHAERARLQMQLQIVDERINIEYVLEEGIFYISVCVNRFMIPKFMASGTGYNLFHGVHE